MDSLDTRRSADAVIEQRPVAVRFDCPWCGERNRVDIGCFAWEDLMPRAEACECGRCGQQVELDRGIELD